MIVRKLLPERYHLATTLVRACLRDRSDAPDAWQREDADRFGRRQFNLRWELVALNDALAAYAAAWEGRPHKFRFDLVVHPQQRRQGLGASLFETILAAVQSNGAQTLQARVDAADVPSLAFLRRREFRDVHRMVEMRRALAGEDQTMLGPTILGLEIFTAVEGVQLDSAFWSKLHAAHIRAATDWPDPDPGGHSEGLTVEQFQRLFSDCGVPWAQLFVARVNGKWIGYTGIAVHALDPTMACTGPTAVDPAYRGRGIATALKAAALASAARAGCLLAQSRSANPAMLRVNTKLGFELHHAEVRLLRQCHGPPNATLR